MSYTKQPSLLDRSSSQSLKLSQGTLRIFICLTFLIFCLGSSRNARASCLNFTPQPVYNFSAPHSPVTAYFDGDRNLDLAVITGYDIAVQLGKGDGTFGPAMRFSVGNSVLGSPSALIVGDFNGDGKRDLAVTTKDGSGGGGNVSILLGNGDGTFGQPTNISLPGSNTAGGIVVANFRGLRMQDLLITDGQAFAPGKFWFLASNGDGTFAPPAWTSAPGEPAFVAAADFNGDGKVDIVCVDNQTGGVDVLLGNDDGTFQTASRYYYGHANNITLADLRGNGRLDILVAAWTSGLGVLLSNGDGTFGSPVAYASDPAGGRTYNSFVFDFDQDGKQDIWLGGDTPNYNVLLGNGAGAFSTTLSYPGAFDGGAVMGDFNGDGRPDIVVASSYGNYVEVYLNSGCCATPIVNAAGPTTFCSGGSVALMATAGSSYLWSNGATTQSISVIQSGNYSVMVTNGSGCSATSQVTTITVTPPPVAMITASGPTTFCAGGSVTLTAPAAASYQWSNGATTQSIVVTQSGTYTVTASATNGCSTTSDPVRVSVSALPDATVVASGPTAFCAGGSVTLTAPTAASYQWSNGATTQSIVVTQGGAYSVTLSSASGCGARSEPLTVRVNPVPTFMTADWQLTAGAGLSIHDSTGNGNDAQLGANPFPDADDPQWVADARWGSVLAFAGTSYLKVPDSPSLHMQQLSAEFWIVDNGNLGTSGNYRFLLDQYANGNTSEAYRFLTEGDRNLYFEVTGAGSSPGFFENNIRDGKWHHVVGTYDGGFVRLFIDGAQIGNGTPAPQNPSPIPYGTGGDLIIGTYRPGQYDTASQTFNGRMALIRLWNHALSAAEVAARYQGQAASIVSASGPTTFCAGGSVTLAAPTAASYQWSNGAATQSIVVTQAGTYTVTATAANGCSTTSDPVVTSIMLNSGCPPLGDTTPPVISSCAIARTVVACSSAVPDFTTSVVASDNSNGALRYAQSPVAGTILPIGSYTVHITVTDPSGNQSSCDTTFNVINNPPTATAGGPYSVTEGGDVTVSATGSDPDGGTVTYSWDRDGDGSFETSGQSVRYHGADGPGTAMIRVKVTDGCGLSSISQAQVNVGNVVPAIGAITGVNGPVSLGNSITLSAPFTDAGILDTHVAAWSWDDGTTGAAAVAESGGSGTASGTHLFSAPGVYRIGLTVTDKDGGAASAFFEYVVIYDPTGGFVTGGGWINSPAGAYVADKTLAGKASFGFNSKYQKGASIPTGGTQFQFHVAKFIFNSTSYQWLVVAGAKAQYKGDGVVNGQGSYGFLLTGTDGDVSGGGGVDKFRIKIWDKVSGAIMYDNVMNGSDDIDAAAPQAIAGGSIVIHK
ncbi:MAG TPA: FG-GAP-like repeat-containing protein [Thermoanaerobaculia bacterium]|nr:FG-GAP-like repeat-containing protein [Thermoanaerobaculia bacterium]